MRDKVEVTRGTGLALHCRPTCVLITSNNRICASVVAIEKFKI